jgi:hypothetical protein
MLSQYNLNVGVMIAMLPIVIERLSCGLGKIGAQLEDILIYV